jgi:hypothetical protein
MAQLTASDVVTEDTVAQMVQNQRAKKYRFRMAFRDHDGSGAGNSVRFPKADTEFEGDMAEVAGGSTYPRVKKSYSDVSAAYTKYGFEAPITDEAIADSMLDLELDNLESMAKEEQRRLDAIAYGVLSANVNATTVGAEDDGSLGFDKVVDARAEHTSQGYEPDLLFVEPLGAASILKSDEFSLRDTPVGDRAVTEGFIGSVVGLDIYESNTGDLGQYHGLMVDSEQYGYETAKDGENGISSYREEEKDQTVYKVRDRMDWVSMDAGAALQVLG